MNTYNMNVFSQYADHLIGAALHTLHFTVHVNSQMQLILVQ